MKKLLLISGLIGIILGALSAHTFFIHSWLALVPWGIVGIAIGYFSGGKKQGIWAGAFYGFFLCVSFLIAGFKGSSFVRLIPLLIAMGLLGKLSGLVLGIIGNWIKNKTTP